MAKQKPIEVVETPTAKTPVEVADTPEALLAARGGDLGGEWIYECTLPGGTKKFVLAKSPNGAGAKLVSAKRCTQKRIVEAALSAMKRDRESLFYEKGEADDAA